jgi:hypothetical protein
MYSILFSFLKPQLCYGGESTGGGGDGGSSDKGRGSSYGMEGAGDGAATSAGQARAAQLRAQAEAQRAVQQQARDNDRDRRTAVSKARSAGKAAAPVVVSNATKTAEDNNGKLTDNNQVFKSSAKNPTGLSSSKLVSSAKNKNYTNLTAAEQGALYGQYGQQPNAAEYAQMTEVMKRMRNVPSTSEFQSSVADQLRAGTTRRGGIIDADAAAKSAQNYISNNPVGENVNPFFTPYSELDGFFPKLERGIENAGIFAIKGLTGGIIDPVKIDKDMAEKYMKALQETGTYDYDDPNYLDISDSKQGNANFDKILEMSGRGPEDYEATNILRGVKDAEGNTVAGFNQYQNTITGYDPKTGEYESGAVVYNEEEREEDRDRDRCPEGFYYDVEEEMCMPIVDSLVDPDPTCPDGYTFDSEENACVLDPFQQPFPDAPTTGGGTYTAPALSPYTSVSPVTLPSLMPGQQQQYMVPTPNVQPITVAAQTPVGLASLRRS